MFLVVHSIKLAHLRLSIALFWRTCAGIHGKRLHLTATVNADSLLFGHAVGNEFICCIRQEKLGFTLFEAMSLQGKVSYGCPSPS